MKQNPISFQLKLNPEDFLPASEEEKESLVIMRESASGKTAFAASRKIKWRW